LRGVQISLSGAAYFIGPVGARPPIGGQAHGADSMELDLGYDGSSVYDPLMDTDIAADDVMLAAEPAAAVAEAPAAEWEPAALDTAIGTNVTWYDQSRHSDVVLFVDQLKGSWPWLTRGAEEPTPLDENGYPTALPEDGRVFSKLMARSPELDGVAPFTGDFRLYGQGDAVFRLTATTDWARTDIVTADLPTEVIDGTEYWYVDFNYSSASADGKLRSVEMKLFDMVEGDHLRDMALVHHSHLDAHRAGAMFAPELISDLAAYDTLRFMDWMGANKYDRDGWEPTAPEQRYIDVDHFTFNTSASGWDQPGVHNASAPIEAIVELANATDSNPWISLPVDITDSRALALADYVADNLEEGRAVYWEYGNELWNGGRGFEGFKYAESRAKELWGLDNLHGAAEWAAYRGPQIYAQIDTVLAGDDAEAHYVAPSWATWAPLRANGEVSGGSYTVRYFEAEMAQTMADAGPAPADIATDYAIGLYVGGTVDNGRPDAPVAEHIVAHYDTPEAQAEALADWMLFGADAEATYELGRAALTEPVTGVAYSADLSIGLAPLLWADHEAGHDVLGDLGALLRLEGTDLQYRGANAAEWTTILRFAAAPERTLEQMIADVQIIGHGHEQGRSVFSGLKTSVARTADIRLERHAPYIAELGLDFTAYEGGPHLFHAVDGGHAMYQTFSYGGWAAEVQQAWLERIDAAGVDLYNHYMSHNRVVGGNWGSREYVGQDLEDAPKAELLERTIELSAGDQPAPEPVPDTLSLLEAARLNLNGDWRYDPQSADLTETAGDGTLSTIEVALTEELRGSDLTLTARMSSALAEAGNLRIVAQAFGGGGGAEIIAGDQQAVADGGTFALDLGVVPQDYTDLRLMVRRTGAAAGTLSLSDFGVTAA